MGEPALLVFFYVSLGLFGCGASLSRHSAQHVQFVVEEIQMNEIAMENAVPTAIDPPPHELAAKMARYIVHSSDWTALSTISTHEPIVGYPFANVFSVSDGPVDGSTGVPYMYFTDMEISVQDMKKDSRASITMSLAQSDYCKRHRYDPENPLCAHVILTGSIEKVKNHEELLTDSFSIIPHR